MSDWDNWENARNLHRPGEPIIANVEAEAALLGTMMIMNEIIPEVRSIVEPDDFVETLHGRVFTMILKMQQDGQQANPVTLRPYFETDPAMRELGGPGYLARLTGSGAGLIGYRTFAQQVAEMAKMREMRARLRDGIDLLENLSVQMPDTGAIASSVATDMYRITETSSVLRPKSPSQILQRALDRQERLRSGSTVRVRCATITDLQDLGGAEPGTLTVIGGRPGMGKSVLMQSAAWGYALAGHDSMMISLEMTEDQQAMRLAADVSFAMNEAISFRNITRGTMSLADEAIIAEAIGRTSQLPLKMLAPGRCTIEEIEAHVGRYVAQLERLGRKLATVWVDYAQIIASSGHREMKDRVSHTSERMLALCKRHDLAGFLLSQLSRTVESRTDKRPLASDLKESGRLEEDADAVWLLYRPEVYMRNEEPTKEDVVKWNKWDEDYQIARGRVDLIAPKIRMGEPGTRRLKFYGDNQAIRGSDYVEPMFDEPCLLGPDGRCGVAF